MSAEVTPEKIMALGEKWIQRLLQTLSPEERIAGLSPEDVIKQYRPEDVLKQYRPEDVLKQYRLEDVLKLFRPEEIEAYLQEIKKQQKAKNGGPQTQGA